MQINLQIHWLPLQKSTVPSVLLMLIRTYFTLEFPQSFVINIRRIFFLPFFSSLVPHSSFPGTTLCRVEPHPVMLADLDGLVVRLLANWVWADWDCSVPLTSSPAAVNLTVSCWTASALTAFYCCCLLPATLLNELCFFHAWAPYYFFVTMVWLMTPI